MGNRGSRGTDLTDRLARIRKDFYQDYNETPDPSVARDALQQVTKVAEELDTAIEQGEVRVGDHTTTELQGQIKELQRRLTLLCESPQKSVKETPEAAVRKLFPKVASAVDRYLEAALAAGREAEIPWPDLLAHLLDGSSGRSRWLSFAREEETAVRSIKPDDDRRYNAIVAWNQLAALIGDGVSSVQETRERERKEKEKSFLSCVEEAEKKLSEGWGNGGSERLRRAVTAFRNSVLSAGWSISDRAVGNFYGDVSSLIPGNVLLADEDRDNAPDDGDVTELQATGDGTSHGTRIKTYLREKVARRAHRAGLNLRNPAVIRFLRDVATEWCSAVESSDTGGNASLQANSVRGYLDSNLRDEVDESRTANLSLTERILILQGQINREIDPVKKARFQRFLKELQERQEQERKKK